MVRRRRMCIVPCLALVAIFFYVWPIVNDLLPLGPLDDYSRLLAEDALQAARDSVHEYMQTLLATYEDELRTIPGRDGANHVDTRFEKPQASLYDVLQESSPHNTVRDKLSGLPSVKGRLVTDVHEADPDICASLAGKRVTMIGGEHIYRLHLLLLQYRERAEGKQFPCPYHEFCTHHHICLPFQHGKDAVPSPRYIKPPTTQALVDTASAAINYIVSDTLFSARNESSWEYTLPFVDPLTGVRLRETHWLAAARKANVVILGRGPLSAPGETYASNWSFLRNMPDYVDRSRIVGATTGRHHVEPATVPNPLEILNAAVHLTVSRFLPDTFQLLRSVQREVRPARQKRLIWPSSWYRLPGRGVARTSLLSGLYRRSSSKVQDMFMFRRTLSHRVQPQSWAGREREHILALHLSVLINADGASSNVLEDLWTLLFNTQGTHGTQIAVSRFSHADGVRDIAPFLVYLQNMVLRELLPRCGIIFLPLDDVTWVEVAGAHSRGHNYGTDEYAHVATKVDVERTAAIGDRFLRELERICKMRVF